MTDTSVLRFAIAFLFISYSQVKSVKAIDASEFDYYSSSVNLIPQETFVQDHRYEQYIRRQYKIIDRDPNIDVGPNKDIQVDDIGRLRNETKISRILVTGGAGFIGSHLVDSLLLDGHTVIVIDDLSTGRLENLLHWKQNPNFLMIIADVREPMSIAVDQIYHLASPASPVHYMKDPIKTMTTNFDGTRNMLKLSAKHSAKFLLASTSETYGDPLEHPQEESYWGNVNPVGPRSSYDESKRCSEALAVAFHQTERVKIGIARIFNTYGPRMRIDDGRVISNFIVQALRNESLTIYGNGNQTRSFLYITDLIEGLKALMQSNEPMPVNIGNDDEISILKLIESIDHNFSGRKLQTKKLDRLVDDPQRRKPNVAKAFKVLHGWKPKVLLKDGLKYTIDYFKKELNEEKL